MYDKEKQELLDTTLKMLENDLVIGSSGNASLRVGNHVLITPSSVHYDSMCVDDIVVVDLDERVIEGHRTPSIESPTHLSIYKNRQDAKAVVHSHSVYATAFALLDRSLPSIIDEVVPKFGGDVRLAKYGMPGTDDLAVNVVEALEDRSAVFMKNHGALCIGKDLDEALHFAILLERTCRTYLVALQADQPTILPEEAVEVGRSLWEFKRMSRMNEE
jgi:L-fuculose-phosphate aldolase